MPLYDFRCAGSCGYFEDMFIPLAKKDDAVCPECKGAIIIRIGAVMTVGPMPSKPLRIEQIGRSFESASEVREYKKQNPGWEIESADSASWRKHVDDTRERAERVAKRRGYRDLAQQHEKRKKEKAKQRGEIDNKVFV
jgi:putative FmdB family regulatory protein